MYPVCSHSIRRFSHFLLTQIYDTWIKFTNHFSISISSKLQKEPLNTSDLDASPNNSVSYARLLQPQMSMKHFSGVFCLNCYLFQCISHFNMPFWARNKIPDFFQLALFHAVFEVACEAAFEVALETEHFSGLYNLFYHCNYYCLNARPKKRSAVFPRKVFSLQCS